MSKIYQFLSCTFLGFSLSGLLATVAKDNELTNTLMITIIAIYTVIPIIYFILLGIGIKWKVEKLTDTLLSIFKKDYISIYSSLLTFLIGIITFIRINHIKFYG